MWSSPCLDEVCDPRDPGGRRWQLGRLLASALLGLVAGSRSLREVEQLTAELTPAVRAKLGIPRRVPDTTLRDALSSLEPDDAFAACGDRGRPAWRAPPQCKRRRSVHRCENRWCDFCACVHSLMAFPLPTSAEFSRKERPTWGASSR
ncbi:MAG: transposase family protein [Myxococcales bacterium]|nr:transposase family protein [Myxococcales bacterium]